MTFCRSLAALISILGLSACNSVPTHYYTLLSPLSSQADPGVHTTAFQFEMAPVRMPVQVDQPQLVIRQSNGSLAILETERWGAPLGDEFHDALVGQLEQQLGTRDLAGLPKSSDKPVLTLRTDVRRFDTLPGRYALIDVVWSLNLRDEGSTRRTLTCSSVIRETAGTEFEDLVIAHQKAIASLANTIAYTAQQWHEMPKTECP
jgi:uncharacterized lipoprotein YmbA